MATHPDYPGLSSMTDRHGKIRWRNKKLGIYLPGQPGEPAFDAAYQAMIEGRTPPQPKPKAELVALPRAAHPQSLYACWEKAKLRPKFLRLDAATRYQYTYLIEDFLDAPMGNGMKRGAGPVADLEAHHIQDILDRMSPSNSVILRVVLKKLFKEAALQGWIKYSPLSLTEAVERDPTAGHKTWPAHICAKFEAAHNLGTTPRTVYEIAKWTGLRVSDIVRLRWDMLVTKIIDGEAVHGFEFVEHKGRNRTNAFSKFHPMTPMLEAALAHLDRSTGGHLVVGRWGKPFVDGKILSQRLWEDWGPWADIPAGFTFHGLRKAMGAMLVDADASLHQSRDLLGHATYKEVATYNRGRDQARSAAGGAKAIVKLVRG
jgi:site-specific recombinase XerC